MATYDYSNGKIYTIRSHQTDKYYIGSTRMKTLAQRLGNHRLSYKKHLDGSNDYTSSFQILQYSDHYIELLENYPCESQEQLRKREGEFIRQYKSDIVNINIAGRSMRDYNKEYRVSHKEEIVQQQAQYYESHKEQIKAYQQVYNETHKEQIKAYNETHKEQIKAYNQAYNETHKELIKVGKAKRQVQFNCECGSSGTSQHLLRHNTSKKHLNYIQQILTTNIETLPIIELTELLI